jgi:hypothetical protein
VVNQAHASDQRTGRMVFEFLESVKEMIIMPVNTINNAGSNYVSQVQPQPQTFADRTVEAASNKDREDAAKAAAAQAQQQQAQAQPTVNTSGQTVGAVINVKA